eukprot:CFRG5351T1
MRTKKAASEVCDRLPVVNSRFVVGVKSSTVLIRKVLFVATVESRVRNTYLYRGEERASVFSRILVITINPSLSRVA